jgi:glycosyltransferase involved in cell wall biosynthesis
MPMTIIESFSAGTPVIASDLGAMSSMIKNDFNGLHFKANDLESFKNTIQNFVNFSIEKKIRMRQNSLLSFRDLYTSEKQIFFFNDLYKKAIILNNVN